jgi:hypothetical protein
MFPSWTCPESGREFALADSRGKPPKERYTYPDSCQHVEGGQAKKLHNRNNSTSAAGGPSILDLMKLSRRNLSAAALAPSFAAEALLTLANRMAPTQEAIYRPGHKLPPRDDAIPA